MKPINFYPGPSALYPEITDYLMDAFTSGILEQNHRSNRFMELLENTISTFKLKLNVPQDYHVFFVSSATEAWEIVSQSLITGSGSFLYNGDFGKKWYEYCLKNNEYSVKKSEIAGIQFDIESKADNAKLAKKNNFIAMVSNETSNGTQIANKTIKSIKKAHKDALIFVDATSNMAGYNFDFALADIWLASSQKCFGLPSGLGVMVVSPRVIAAAKAIDENYHYNSLLNIYSNFKKYQTPYTPNILGIYLLNRVLNQIENINIVSQKITDRARYLYKSLNEINGIELLVQSPELQSETVIAFTSKNIDELKKYLANRNILIGNGYGKWKDNTLRIANFPAIPNQHYDILIETLKDCSLK